MKRIFLYFTLTLLFFLALNGINLFCNVGSAEAELGWKQEYAAVCAETQNAMMLSANELKDNIERCDKLKERLYELEGQEGNTQRKVYEKRLKMCRDLYMFTLEYKER